MNYSDLIASIKRFGAADEDICAHVLGMPSTGIHEDLIISPGWEPETRLPGLGQAELLVPSGPLFGYKMWNIKNDDMEMTYIKTGFGAPPLMDALLSLGVSKCKRILFVSSVGALDNKFGIGDIVIPEYSVCGDGASRYIASDNFGADIFGEKVYPDSALVEHLKTETESICSENDVKWHIGKTFCTDTIFAQFPHIDNIIGMGCNTVDMETAAAFRAAALIKVPLAAIFNISDNTVANKSLIRESTRDEREYRRFVREELMPKIIRNFFKVCKGCK